jgi:hypothetical protein
MAKKKDQKKKERERRVAQKKIAAAQKRVQEKAKEGEKSFPQKKKGYSVEPTAKPVYTDTNRKSPFTQRKSSGG